MKPWGSAAIRHRSLVRATAASALFLVAWSFLHTGVFAREYHKLSGDVTIYQGYGDAVRDGGVPYRDFPVDYPPGALPAFIAPAWSSDYGMAFEGAMLLCGLAVVFLVGVATPGWLAPLSAGVSPFLVGDLLRTRFDLLPAALATGAMVALLRDRHRVGWALLGAAIAVKAYPLCLCPLAALWTARRAGRAELGRAVAWCAAVLVAGFLPFFVLAPHGTWTSVWGQISRPLQIESLGGAMLMTARRAVVLPSHGSDNIAGTPAQLLAAASAVAEVAALLWCWFAFGRGDADRARFCRLAAASVCAFVAFGKVLSPQYLIWLIPFVVLVPGRRGLVAIGLLGAACLLTDWWIPSRYYEYDLQFRWAWVVLSRDLVLVALFVLLAWPAGRSRRAGPAVPAPAR